MPRCRYAPALMFTAVALAVAASTGQACTFCDGSIRTRQPLRVHFGQARVVVLGTLKNARLDPRTNTGTTELHVTAVLKDDPTRTNGVLTLPWYLPPDDASPTGCLVYCRVAEGRVEPVAAVPASAAVVEYVKGGAGLTEADANARLGFFFAHLSSSDPAVAADAFLEFARSPDADLITAARRFDRVVVRKLIADPSTPADRLGVYAFLLGACGTVEDARYLADLLTATPRPARVSAAYGGLLAGYILLAPAEGWALAASVLGDSKRDSAELLAVLNTVRYFQATRAAACRTEVIRCCSALLTHGEFADQAVEDLRRWGWWDISGEVFLQFGKETYTAPIVRRSIVRYALSCPTAGAKEFLENVRKAEPKLVQDVEARMNLYPAPAK